MLIGLLVLQFLILLFSLIWIRIYQLKVRQLRRVIRKGKYYAFKDRTGNPDPIYSSVVEAPFVDSKDLVWAVMNGNKVVKRFSQSSKAETHMLEIKKSQEGISKLYIAFDPEFESN